MDKKRSTYTTADPNNVYGKRKYKESSNKARGDCEPSGSSSHTQYFREEKYKKEFIRINSDQYVGKQESLSTSSDTYQCVHGPQGKQYSPKGKVERSYRKVLDPFSLDRKNTDECEPAASSCEELGKTLEFLVSDPTGNQQTDRIITLLQDFDKMSRNGYKIEVLDSLCVILEYLVEQIGKKDGNHSTNQTGLRECMVRLIENIQMPIILTRASDVITQFGTLQNYIGFLGYLLLRVEEDEHFECVSRGVLRQMSSSRHVLRAAPLLLQTATRMLALASPVRFPAFQQMTLLLACDSAHNCIEMIKENIIENLFYRFNPYFPEKLPSYEVNPINPQDFNVKLGDSSVNMSTTLSLLLVLVKTLKNYLTENPKQQALIPHPDFYSQRCFIWAYRYECRAREHRHQRMVLTVIAHVLLHCFGQRLVAFSSLLMPDVMALSVRSEIPPRNDWTRTVEFNKAQADVHFKKLLIYLSVDFLKVFPYNKSMVESHHWLQGLMFLVDPGLSSLRARWSQSLYAELRKTVLQALVCTIPIITPTVVRKYDIIRRIMWYIEWYSESPYELPVLYWCVRVLQVAIHDRDTPTRMDAISDLFDTHGIIILMKLVHTILDQKCPPVERSQAVLAQVVRLLTSAVGSSTRQRLCCVVYPRLQWPASLPSLAMDMLRVVLYSLDNHFIVSDRWLISLLNFIWEAIIWKKEHREKFILKKGVYNLLDIVTMSAPPVQCLALALVCDVARAGEAVAQLVTWRAALGASNANPGVVKRGATIASLLAAIFRDECVVNGIQLDQYGVIKDLDSPLMSLALRKDMARPEFSVGASKRTPVCLPAAELAGSRMSKAYALLQLLSEDLAYKVVVADEAYNLYKNIKLELEDETILELCSHFLTLKLNETWIETKIQNPGLLPQDEDLLKEFIDLNTGWAKEIKRIQEHVVQNRHKMDTEEENSFYAFMKRVRLNSALDALREVRCVARSARAPLAPSPTVAPAPALAPGDTVRTYQPPLDDQDKSISVLGGGMFPRLACDDQNANPTATLLPSETRCSKYDYEKVFSFFGTSLDNT